MGGRMSASTYHQAGHQVNELSLRAEELLLEKQTIAQDLAASKQTNEELSAKLRSAEAALSEERSTLDRKAKDEAAAQALAAKRSAEYSENEQQWAEKLRQATSRFENTMKETEREWVRKVSEVEKDWAQRLESAERRWGREKAEIEKQVMFLLNVILHKMIHTYWLSDVVELRVLSIS
eukprot:scaffold96337_cov48-Prasinocladus_malaysianus.AAC.1